MKPRGSENFTLIEVVVALALLSVSLAGLLQLSINSQQKLITADDKWRHEHMLAQAAEYLMLVNEDNASVPDEFFPYPGYSVEVEIDDAEDLPEEYNELVGQLPLKCWYISIVRQSDAESVASVHIDRINYDEETSN